MPVISFPIATGAQLNPSQDANYQRKVNVFPVPAGDFGRGDTEANNMVLLPTAGLLEIAQAAGNIVREIINVNNQYIYAIVDNVVYNITFPSSPLSAVLTSIGTMTGNPSLELVWDNNRTQIMLVNGTALWGYVIDYIANTLTQVTPVNFLGGATVTQLDGYFITNQPGTQTMQVSALNDGLTWDALDVASAESKADNLIGVIADKGELIAIGGKTIEFWYDAANPSGFPFSKRPGEYYNIGCSARKTILSIDNTIFLVDHRRYFCALSSDGGLQVLSPPWFRKVLNSYTTVSDGYAYEFEDAGQLMYVVCFPSEGKCWAYDLSTQQLHERAYLATGDVAYSRHRVSTCIKYNNYYLAGDYANGKIYIYSRDYKSDNGVLIRRLLTIPYFHALDALITINDLYIHGDFGHGSTIDPGSNPQIMLRYSSDGGHTWNTELFAPLGELGNYAKRLKFYRIGTEREWLFEISFAESVDFSLAELGLNIEVSNV